MSIRVLCISVFCWCMGVKAHAQQITFSSLNDVWQYAEKNNMSIVSAQSSQAMADKTTRQSYGNLFPTVTANGSFTDNIRIQPTLIPANLFNQEAPAGTFVEATFGRRYIYNTNLTAQLNILNTEDWFAIASAKYSHEAARLAVNKTIREVYEQTASAYYNYLLLKEVARLSEQNILIADSILVNATQKFTEGQVSEVSVNTAQINHEKAQKTWQIAVQNRQIALNTLKSLLGLSVNDSLSLSEVFSSSLPEPLTIQSSYHPEVELARSQVLLAKTTWQAAKASFAPKLSVVYQWNTQISGDKFWQFTNTNSLPQEYWGLRLSIPILAGSSRLYQIQKSRIDWQYKEKYYENIRKQADIQDDNLRLSFANAYDALKKSETILELYRQNDQHANRQLAQGTISLDDRLRAFSDYLSGQNDYLESLSDYMVQYYRVQIRNKAL